MRITYERGSVLAEIEFDAMMRSSDVMSATVTSHPVEKGSPANDHIHANADTFTFDAVVSNTPLRVPTRPSTQQRDTTMGGAKAVTSGKTISYETITYDNFRRGNKTGQTTSVGVLQFDREFNRVKNVYDELKYIETNGLTVNVLTVDGGGVRDYQNMAILNVTVPRELDDGSARTFSFQLQELRIVETKKVKAPKARKQVKNHGNKGKKEVKPDADAQLRGAALQFLQFVGVLK